MWGGGEEAEGRRVRGKEGKRGDCGEGRVRGRGVERGVSGGEGKGKREGG